MDAFGLPAPPVVILGFDVSRPMGMEIDEDLVVVDEVGTSVCALGPRAFLRSSSN